MKNLHPIYFLIVATLLEVSGDALVRMGIHENVVLVRAVLFGSGAVLLFGYGSFLNLAPLEFGEVVGLYIATLFVNWQIVNFLFFRTLPTMPSLVGGALVILGGLIISFWHPHPAR